MSQRNESPRFAAKNVKMPDFKMPDLNSKPYLYGRLGLAALFLILGAFVFKNQVLRYVFLVLSAILSAYDLGLKAFDSVVEKKYFATPILLLFVAFVSFLIGYPTEGAAVLLLYQLSLFAVDYVQKRTRGSAMQMLNGLDQEQAERAGELYAAEDAGKLKMEGEIFRSADLMLKIAMIFSLLYIFLLPRLGDYSYKVSIHRALMIMMTAIPASVVAAMPYTALVGLCFSARSGVLFRNGAALEKTADINVVALDKAGIFSVGEPELAALHSDRLDQNTFLSLIAHAVYYSEQPFTKAIPALPEQDYKLDVITDFEDVPGCGVVLKLGGSPVVLATREYLAENGISVPETGETGDVYYLTLAGRYVGYLCIVSQMNESGTELLEGIRETNMRELILLTEDGAGESQRMGEDLGFDEVFGECDVERKLRYIDNLNQGSRNHVMFVYANGLETHTAADVDVRLSQKAKFADATVLPENANALPMGIQIARRMCQVAKENAIFVFVIKALMIILSMLGFCTIWFVLFMDVVAVLATMLNAIRVTKEPLINLSRFSAPKEEQY